MGELNNLGASFAKLDLSGTYRLSSPNRPLTADIMLPGDVHTALIDSQQISNPYFGGNEQAVMWVTHTPWTIEGSFDVDAGMLDGFLTLTLSEVDCTATVVLNGEAILSTDNAFVRHDIDVTGKIRARENNLRIDFAVARDIAKARYDAHPFPIPFTNNYLTNGLEGVHMNFIRKAACHAGWDWGICLMPIGVYGTMSLRRSRLARQDSVQVDQVHREGAVDLLIKTHVHAYADGEVSLTHRIGDQQVGGIEPVRRGDNILIQGITIANPALWWPNGQGEQPLYELTTELDGEVSTRKLGLRKLDWVIEKDEIDHSFKARINDRDITMMGANWIPADAIPSRITREAVRDLLESAAAANMNMIRVWGGGQYEPDFFYEICDELGILIWHDFMFSCMPYPSDRAFLSSVETEITQQVRRLSHHACIALWCGDNEVIGSLTWYPETKANRDRFVANYDRLSKLLNDIVEREDPVRRFWPSSPSLGYLDFSDGWHVDTRGDMHYWDVWHSAKPFEAYRQQHPRFASEFGFQSFTSMDVIEDFALPEDRNPSSPVMESHQRNEGGNARILETMTRYFRFPSNFTEMIFLSQIQQGLAIKTAIEYWRSTKPRCMGTLFWQINDTWPVASWSSMNHGGSWKVMHYMARRFFLPLNVVAYPDPKTGEIVLKGINDTALDAGIILEVRAVDVAGPDRIIHSAPARISPDRASELARIPAEAIREGEFLFFTWRDEAGVLIGENDFFPRAYKYYSLEDATIAHEWSEIEGQLLLTLKGDKLALFVTVNCDIPGYFSDNSFTLLPGETKQLRFIPRLGATASIGHLSHGTTVRHLAQTY